MAGTRGCLRIPSLTLITCSVNRHTYASHLYHISKPKTWLFACCCQFVRIFEPSHQKTLFGCNYTKLRGTSLDNEIGYELRNIDWELKTRKIYFILNHSFTIQAIMEGQSRWKKLYVVIKYSQLGYDTFLWIEQLRSTFCQCFFVEFSKGLIDNVTQFMLCNKVRFNAAQQVLLFVLLS